MCSPFVSGGKGTTFFLNVQEIFSFCHFFYAQSPIFQIIGYTDLANLLGTQI